MDYFTICGIAVGLSMDAFAVSITSGFVTKNLKVRQAFRMAIFFGSFQAIMPIIGWMSGLFIRNLIASYDHWIAFALLSFIGLKMIYESLNPEKDEHKACPMEFQRLIILSIATSIDALAVGFSLSFLNLQIIIPAIIIGIITFSISFLGVFLGKQFGHIFENRLEQIGGLILIGIGIKILFEHLK